jgi:hypothetical protein
VITYSIVNGTNEFVISEFLDSMDGVQFIYKMVQVTVKMFKLQ